MGACNVAKLLTAQRFDGFDGVSCLVHSDGSALRWTVSVGQGLDVERLRRIFARAHEACEEMARE